MKKMAGLAMVLACAMIVALAFENVAFADDVQATVVGKIAVGNNVASLKISEAKGADGKEITELKDKLLRVIGAKANDAVRMAGKVVEIKGVIKNNIAIDPTSIVEKAAPTPKK